MNAIIDSCAAILCVVILGVLVAEVLDFVIAEICKHFVYWM